MGAEPDDPVELEETDEPEDDDPLLNEDVDTELLRGSVYEDPEYDEPE